VDTIKESGMMVVVGRWEYDDNENWVMNGMYNKRRSMPLKVY
jgi:hypothetical protein